MISCLEHRVKKPVFPLACWCLSLGLLTLMVGCSKSPHSAEHADVSGKVLFQGQPLPGGKVTFVAVNGGFASTGTIDENGDYQIKAPVGAVEISVTNQTLQSRGGPMAPRRPKKAEAKKDQPTKGRWVKIPSQYGDPHTSGLSYTVKSGSQTHDIELLANPSSAAGVPGSRLEK
ncbi:MAG TPA: carboxypeptidase-like regulatory domain-containing protein [Gemmataceae bacterium]|nr:carboxypeptidase-like regulatory domain-containing protein [Gemmataceae bacterium]